MNTSSKKRVLVIEDEPAVCQNMLDILSSGGFQGLSAPNAAAGLELARNELPDLILCDIMMPDQDGYAVLNALRQRADTSALPVIFVTAKTERDDFRRGMDLGADDYITKPFRRTELLQAIETRLQRNEELRQQATIQLDQLGATVNQVLPHEMRTVLTGILGFAELIGSSTTLFGTNDVADMAHMIYDSGIRLQQLLENFILYTRLELMSANPRQLEELRHEFTPDAGYVTETTARQRAKAAQRADDLIVSVTPVSLAIGESYLKKIIEELIDNALKFSAAGTPISVKVTRNSDRVAIAVRDAGVGITTEELTLLSSRTADKNNGMSRQGVRLGLAIARKLVEVHGGNLAIDSVAEKGTTVTAIFPLPAVESADAKRK